MFHAAGAEHRERLFEAANQVGKTLAGAAETALHLTGKYGLWEKKTGLQWIGRRFAGPVNAWAGSAGYEATRDGVQRLLVGPPKIESQWGTGMVPGDDLLATSKRQGVSGALDGLVVQHYGPNGRPDGLSTLGFKSYDQGREKWQGDTLHFVWFDEEPEIEIYTEGLTRTNATDGIAFLTFTPLLGRSAVVLNFEGAAGDSAL